MAAAATRALHTIVQEAVDLGVGWNRLYKACTTRSHPGADDIQRDTSHLRGDIKAVEQAIRRVCDNQASLLALVSQGPARIRSGWRPDALEQEITKGFASVAQSVRDRPAIRAARQLKSKLDTATLACNRMMEGIVAATESRQTSLSPSTSRDVHQAERSAAQLYAWAESFVPSTPAAGAIWQSELRIMPYIVAMAYAVRIRAVARALDQDWMDRQCEKLASPKRARDLVDDFRAVLVRALEWIVRDTSLLDIALEHQLPMAMVLTLMTRFHAGAENRDIVVCDDGLAPIRAVLHCTPSAAADHTAQTIALANADQRLWWAAFTGASCTSAANWARLRTSISTRELCQALGDRARRSNRAHCAHPRCRSRRCPGFHFSLSLSAIRCNPGRESALTQLPPACALRAALCAAIARARRGMDMDDDDHDDPPLPPSFARIARTPPPAAPRTLCGHSDAVMCVAICPDGDRVISGSLDGTARVWRVSSGQQRRSFAEHTAAVLCVAVSRDGRRAASGSGDKSVRLWRVHGGGGGHGSLVLRGHSGAVRAVAIAPDDRSIASGSEDATVKIWNADSGECLGTLTGHSHFVVCVAFSSVRSQRLIAGCRDSSIRVWNLRTRALERILIESAGSAASVAVTPDERVLIAGSGDGTVRLRSLSGGGAETMRLEAGCGCVGCVAVFPDRQRIAAGSEDGIVRVWTLQWDAHTVQLIGHTSGVECVAVARDGRSVVSGSRDKTIKVWALSGDDGAMPWMSGMGDRLEWWRQRQRRRKAMRRAGGVWSCLSRILSCCAMLIGAYIAVATVVFLLAMLMDNAVIDIQGYGDGGRG